MWTREVELMIAIKGMEEIPKNCSKCPFSATFPNTGLKNGVCNDLHLPFKRHPYCPLIEIVTCKDCKYNAYETKIKGDESIKIFCRKNKTYRCIDGFCSDGKRRE
jgi:hypothetical protein